MMMTSDIAIPIPILQYLPSTGAREEPQCLTPPHHSCNPTSRTLHFDDDAAYDLDDDAEDDADDDDYTGVIDKSVDTFS